MKQAQQKFSQVILFYMTDLKFEQEIKMSLYYLFNFANNILKYEERRKL